jgi:phosphopantetheinyl transferase
MAIGMRADVMTIPVKPLNELFELWLLKEAACKEEGSVAFFLLKCFGNEFTAICKFIAGEHQRHLFSQVVTPYYSSVAVCKVS